MGWEAITPYLARLLEILLNSANNPRDWKIATEFHIHQGGYRSAFSNYRHISLISVVCRQLEHVIAGYLRQLWDKNDWLYEEKHGFRQGYCCECQVTTVCQDIADSLEEGIGIDAIILEFPKAFDLVYHDRLFTKLAASGVDSRIIVWLGDFLVGRTYRVREGGKLFKEVKVTSVVPQGSILGSLVFLV